MNYCFDFYPTRRKIIVLASSLLVVGLFLNQTIPIVIFTFPFVYVVLSIRSPSTQSPSTDGGGWKGRIFQVILGVLGLLMCTPGGDGFAMSQKEPFKYIISNIVLDIVGWAFITPLAFYIIVRQCRAWISPRTPRLRFGTFLFAVGCLRIILGLYSLILLDLLKKYFPFPYL